MRRAWLPVVLLLSLGVNLGLFAAATAGRWQQDGEAAPGAREETTVPAAPATPVPGEAAPESGPGSARGGARGGGPGGELHGGPGGEQGGDAGGARAGERGAGSLLPHPPVERLADHLGLAGARREQFVSLQRELVANHLRARQERRRLTMELHRELIAAEPDRARLEAITADLGRLLTASERRSAGLILASRDLLTPDQQRAYLRFLERLRAGAGAGPGRGSGRDQRPFPRPRQRP